MTTTPLTSSVTTLGRGIQSELDRIQANSLTPQGSARRIDEDEANSTGTPADTDSFADFMALARDTFNGGGRGGGAAGSPNELENEEDVLRAGAEELVATAFFEPLFKMMREDPLRADVVPLSSGEKMFGPMLHAEFAKQITAKGNFPLVQAIVQSLLPTHAAPEEATKGSALPDRIPGSEDQANEERMRRTTSMTQAQGQPQSQHEGMVDLHG